MEVIMIVKVDEGISCKQCLYLTMIYDKVACKKTGYCIPDNMERSIQCKENDFKKVGVFQLDFESMGIPFRAIHIFPNCYSPNFPFKSSQSIIEFYDFRYKHTPDGQFITRYNISTLYDSSFENSGLNLNGGVPDWKVDNNAMKKIINWLKFNDRSNH
jgi:hypothetical protein